MRKEIKKEYPTAEEAFRRIVILPLFPSMSENDVKYVVECAKQSIENNQLRA